MNTTYPYCRLISDSKFVIYYLSIATSMVLNHKEVKSIAKLTFSDWIKYLTANKPQSLLDKADLVITIHKPQQDNIKAHTLHYNSNDVKIVKAYNVRPNCSNCNTKLSKDEKEQGNFCSDCINELDLGLKMFRLENSKSLTKKLNISIADVKEEPNTTASLSTGNPRPQYDNLSVQCASCKRLITQKEYLDNYGVCFSCKTFL